MALAINNNIGLGIDATVFYVRQTSSNLYKVELNMF